MSKLTPYEEKLINDFVEYITSVPYVNSIVVYGSRSKGASNILQSFLDEIHKQKIDELVTEGKTLVLKK